jgi:dihydrofolate reductase
MITLIAACSENRVIGKAGKLIWHIPEDLKRFKKLTLGNPIVMGRKTFESIGKPLPGRTNIILTRDKNFKMEGCLVYNKISDILEIFEKNNIFVIGGGEIYKQFLDKADRIELTLIHKNFDGDTYFPQIGGEWEITHSENSKFEDIDLEYISYKKI